MRLAQISDFHFTRPTWNPLRLSSKRLVGQMNWLFARKMCFGEGQLAALPQVLQQLRAEHVLLSGDFTSTALPAEFVAARAWVDQLPCPWSAVPGNHDVYTLGAQWTNRYSRYFGECPAVRALNSSWTLVTVNTAQPSWSSKGLFSIHSEHQLQQALNSIPRSQNILVLNHYSFLNNDRPTRSLRRAAALEQIVSQDPRIKLYLHGHTHRNIVANLQPAGLPIVLDGGCVADTRRGSWNLITLEDTYCRVDVYRWGNGRWAVERSEEIAWRGLTKG